MFVSDISLLMIATVISLAIILYKLNIWHKLFRYLIATLMVYLLHTLCV